MKKDSKKVVTDKKEWVLIYVPGNLPNEGIEILISKDDPWYNELSKEFPNERPYNEEEFEVNSAPELPEDDS